MTTHHYYSNAAAAILLCLFSTPSIIAFTPNRMPTTTTTTTTTSSSSAASTATTLRLSYLDSLATAPPLHCPIISPTKKVAVVASEEVYQAVREELTVCMDNPSWDDGSCAPIFIRLAWHSSGTYDAASGTGGSNGAGMRFGTDEAADPENAGLNVARAFLEPIHTKFPEVSYSDLWIMAAYVGIEHTGGPVIPFTPGRVDHVDDSYWHQENMTYGRLPAAEKYCCPHLEGHTPVDKSLDNEGRVQGWEGLCTHVRHEVFHRMGITTDQEIVALLCGGHVYGRCHPTFSGYAGAWAEHPTEFSNEYATDMLEDDWTLVGHEDTWLDAQGSAELRPAPGNRQYVNQQNTGAPGDDANQMMLISDMILAWDPQFRTQLELYARDEGRLRTDFAAAFQKLTELGCGFSS